MAHLKFAPKTTPFRRPIPKPQYLPHPWTRPTYDAKRHPDPIRRFATMHWTDRPTHVRTDRQADRSFTGKFDDHRPLRYIGERRGLIIIVHENPSCRLRKSPCTLYTQMAPSNALLPVILRRPYRVGGAYNAPETP